MFELTILSIFRQSEGYLARYFSQMEQAFALCGKPCHAVWLEGDSEDATYSLLQAQKEKLEALGHTVTLMKFDLRGPYWHSVCHESRWRQLASCWNKCMEGLGPSKIAVCVESDLIWEPTVIGKIIAQLDEVHHVICPMMLTEKSVELFGMDRFYDAWGFSRNGKKFSSLAPYWESDAKLAEDDQFLQVSTGGGMIVSTGEQMKRAKWALDSCILHFPADVNVFMDKTIKIYHPTPEKWKNIGFIERMLRMVKYRAVMLGRSLTVRGR